MDMKEWAKREIEIAYKKERRDEDPDVFDYGVACYKSAYKVFLSLLDDEHSGMSIGVMKIILNRLIDGKVLTPIEDTPDIWNDVTYKAGKYAHYQCKRMSSLFKDVYPDGTVRYLDISRYICVNRGDPSNSWHNGFVGSLIDDKYPITMPYMPPSRQYTVWCTEGLSDPKNGDFDTIGVWYVDRPDGERDMIERFFKEDETAPSFVEITREEYEERMKKDGERNGR